MAFARINPHLFTTTRAGKADVDLEFNIQTGWINETYAFAQGVQSQGIAGTTDEANIGKVPVTNGFNISWVKLNLDYFQPNSLNGTVFQDASIPQRVLENASVGTDQVIDLNITAQKIAEGAVIPSKVPANSFPFSKFVKPQTASVIGGTTTNGGAWYEATVGDYQVVTKKPLNNGVTAVFLVEVWNNTNGTFDGAKITTSTLALSKLLSGQKSCVLAGTGTNNSYYELDLAPWQIACRNNATNGPIALTLDEIWANTAATFDGAKITAGSLTGTKIADASIGHKKIDAYKQFVPFCMGSVNADMSLNKSLNIQAITKNGTGLYRIAFTTAAGDANYVCLPVVNDGSGTVARTSDKSTQAVVIRVTNMNGENVNAGFDFEIKSW